MFPYHITITMGDGSQGKHCDLYPHGAAAAARAADLFPDAAKIDVLRLSTALRRGPRAARRPSRYSKEGTR
ncbi:hypothetical protein [Acidovorax sp. ACV01]|uniref:hypothetical protein n=1 Tax=Acidovorax sp. ACV01 TaxID=2769311 RepID=UPI00177B9B0A|nr:hypothetical protein [Acidovorax sp. ACV01]MBD9395753.1 hypothetical protein [Acidovorax sp. ACV01]